MRSTTKAPPLRPLPPPLPQPSRHRPSRPTSRARRTIGPNVRHWCRLCRHRSRWSRHRQPFPDEPAYVDNYDDAADDADAYPYAYDDWDDGRQRRSSGAGAFAILGFLALGVLALGAGAVLAGVFSSDPGVGGIDPTLTPIPSIQESAQPSESASVAPTSDASTSPSTSPAASGEPVVFPDGFTAEAQTCIPGSASTNGCGSNARSNSGSVWIWVGFAKGTSDDVIGAEIIGPEGETVGTGSIDLASIRCGRSCNGWTYFQFGNLDAGTYEVRVTRNGELAAETSFEVT